MTASSECHLYFEKFNRRVSFTDTSELVPAFASIMRDWQQQFIEGPAEHAEMAFSRYKGRKFDWVVSSDGLCADDLDGKPDNPGDATCDFHYELYRWYRSTFPHHLCLHAAACAFAKGAVLFPTTFESGKSVLSVALAGNGNKILGDDVVALDTQSGELVALGLMPRLRLPLPWKAMGAELAAFVKQRLGLAGRQDTYVTLEEPLFAGLGARAAVAGVVILSRSQKYVPARLTPVGRAEALRSLIGQNFNTAMPVDVIFTSLKAVVMRGQNFKLTYSDLAEACRTLSREFNHGGD